MQLLYLFLTGAGIVSAASTMQQEDSPAGDMPDLSKIPPCALQCLAESVSRTTCQITDVHCQCTTGAQAIAESLGPCLCQSACTPEELMTTLTEAEGICKAALGDEFQAPPPPGPDMCKEMQGAGSGGGQNNTSSSPTGPPVYSNPPSHSGNNTDTTSPSGIQPSSSAAASLEAGILPVISAAALGMIVVGLMAL